MVGVEGILSSVVGREGAEKNVGEVTYGTAVEQFFLCVRSDACLTTLSNIGDNQHRN